MGEGVVMGIRNLRGLHYYEADGHQALGFLGKHGLGNVIVLPSLDV